MEPQVQYAKTSDGVNIACWERGEGPSLIIPGHLFAGIELALLSPQQIALADLIVRGNRRVIRYDGRGMGSSDRRSTDFSLEARIADLDAVISHFSLDKFSLFGGGHSGPPSIAYAARHPDRVSQLILSSTYASGEKYYDSTPALRAIHAMRTLADKEWEFYLRTLAYTSFEFANPDAADAMAQAMSRIVPREQVAPFNDATDQIDVTSMLPQLTVPTLVIHNRANPFSSFELAQELASAIPGAGLVATDDALDAIEEFLEPVEPPPEQRGIHSADQAGIRTVLFTDIVGNTEMMQRLGDDKGRDVLREHEWITRETLKEHGGDEVKTMGDGFMASFGSVTRALDCAIALQRAFEDWNRDSAVASTQTGGQGSGRTEGLKVRIGLNAGEPIEEDGDLFGSMVILAARIAAKAAGGEILIPEPVRHLLTGKTYEYADRGETVLKGFEDAVRLYEVRWRE